LRPTDIGNFVDALDVDEGRVHVEGDELVVAQAQRIGQVLDDEAGEISLLGMVWFRYKFGSCSRKWNVAPEADLVYAEAFSATG